MVTLKCLLLISVAPDLDETKMKDTELVEHMKGRYCLWKVDKSNVEVLYSPSPGQELVSGDHSFFIRASLLIDVHMPLLADEGNQNLCHSLMSPQENVAWFPCLSWHLHYLGRGVTDWKIFIIMSASPNFLFMMDPFIP